MFSPFLNMFGKRAREEDSPSSTDEGTSMPTEDMQVAPEGFEDSASEVDDEPIEEEPEVPAGEFDKSTATMAQLLTAIVPDADIHSSSVVIVGGQSSGKTKMIISMVFHHLIDNSAVTDVMGEKLLKLFRTGEKMVTRRPTKIPFMKMPSGSPCQITINKGKESARFDEPRFDEIVNAVHNESLVRDGRAYQEELRITIAAPGLPNISFTDMPGLITDDRTVSDAADDLTIRKLVKRYIRQPQTTLVVVEPAATEDFDTSQVAPMLKDMRDRGERQHIFDNSVLVLSKCDKIRPGLEGRIMSLIDLSSPNIADYPFKYVVGVVNKIEDSTPPGQEIPATYAEFKQLFRATKTHERTIFESYRNRDPDGTPCDPATQCTTAAVFNQMDKIAFTLVHRSIERGLKSILEKVQQTKEEIRQQCAPPLAFYDRPSGVPGQSGRQVFLEGMRSTLKRLVAQEFKKLHLYECHSYDQARMAADQQAYLDRCRINWPAEFAPGDMFASQKQNEAMGAMSKALEKFLRKVVGPAIRGVLEDEVGGCFSPIHWRFHRVDRFPALVAQLHRAVSSLLPECLEAGREAVSDYLVHFWDYEVPKGVTREQIPGLLEQLKHVALRKVFEQLRALTKGEGFDALLQRDELFVEEAEFAADRDRLRARWEHLHRQEAILETCNIVADNRALRAALEQAYLEQQNVEHTSEEEWMRFWLQAMEDPEPARVVPPSTALFANAQSPSRSASQQQHAESQSHSQSPVPGSQWGSSANLAEADVQDERLASASGTQQSQRSRGEAAAMDLGIYHPTSSSRSHGYAGAEDRHEQQAKKARPSTEMDSWRSYEGVDATSYMAAPVAPAAQSHLSEKSPINPAGSSILGTLASTAVSLGRSLTGAVTSPPAATASTTRTTASRNTAPAGNPFGANYFASPPVSQQAGNPFAFNTAAHTSNAVANTPSAASAVGNPFGAAPRCTPVEDANETQDALQEASPEEKRWEAVDLTDD